jgi:hypothetical protein
VPGVALARSVVSARRCQLRARLAGRDAKDGCESCDREHEGRGATPATMHRRTPRELAGSKSPRRRCLDMTREGTPPQRKGRASVGAPEFVGDVGCRGRVSASCNVSRHIAPQVAGGAPPW